MVKIKAVVEDSITDSWKTVTVQYDVKTNEDAVKRLLSEYRVKDVDGEYQYKII